MLDGLESIQSTSTGFAPPVASALVATQLPTYASEPTTAPVPIITRGSTDPSAATQAVKATVPETPVTSYVAAQVASPPPPVAAPTEALRIVEQTTPAPMANEWDGPWPSETASPPTATYNAQVAAPVAVEEPRQKGIALGALAGLAGLAAIVGSFMPQLNVKSDAPIRDFLGDFKLNDFRGTNLQVAFIAAGLFMLVGAFLAGTGKKFGRGLLAGAGLALVPAAACVYGLARSTMDVSESAADAASGSGQGGTFFDAQLSVGFYVLLAGALLGLFAFVGSWGRSGADRRHGLNSALCLVGALGSVIAGVGQFIPENGAKISDNFSNSLGSKAFVYGRLAMIVLVAACGVVGFLRKSRWGIGLALGGLALYAWQWLSSFGSFGDIPDPPAFLNPGALEAKPHIVTTIGVVAMVIVGVVALVTAQRDTDQTYELR